ncbi:hypothetical protein SBV1_2360004 [Verrucomicrobia bacterium]|nr:hypothetical protein SBV1_2360004 [Verrucomicrobiota bacterium]
MVGTGGGPLARGCCSLKAAFRGSGMSVEAFMILSCQDPVFRRQHPRLRASEASAVEAASAISDARCPRNQTKSN